MIIIRNKLLPFKGFKAITLWPFIFVRKDKPFNEVDLNHEYIHSAQQLELALIGFYFIYFVEWVAKGYRYVSFEREAYGNETNLDYLKTRKHYAWWKYRKPGMQY